MKTQLNTQIQPVQNEKPAKLALSKETVRLLTGTRPETLELATQTRIC